MRYTLRCIADGKVLEKAKESTVRAGLTSDNFPLHLRAMLDRSRGATGYVRGHVGGALGRYGNELTSTEPVCAAQTELNRQVRNKHSFH
jgi:hypothetical protein